MRNQSEPCLRLEVPSVFHQPLVAQGAVGLEKGCEVGFQAPGPFWSLLQTAAQAQGRCYLTREHIPRPRADRRLAAPSCRRGVAQGSATPPPARARCCVVRPKPWLETNSKRLSAIAQCVPDISKLQQANWSWQHGVDKGSKVLSYSPIHAGLPDEALAVLDNMAFSGSKASPKGPPSQCPGKKMWRHNLPGPAPVSCGKLYKVSAICAASVHEPYVVLGCFFKTNRIPFFLLWSHPWNTVLWPVEFKRRRPPLIRLSLVPLCKQWGRVMGSLASVISLVAERPSNWSTNCSLTLWAGVQSAR